MHNLVLLCRRHHIDLHAGHWTITITDGIVHVARPTWADPPPQHTNPPARQPDPSRPRHGLNRSPAQHHHQYLATNSARHHHPCRARTGHSISQPLSRARQPEQRHGITILVRARARQASPSLSGPEPGTASPSLSVPEPGTASSPMPGRERATASPPLSGPERSMASPRLSGLERGTASFGDSGVPTPLTVAAGLNAVSSASRRTATGERSFSGCLRPSARVPDPSRPPRSVRQRASPSGASPPPHLTGL